MPKIKRYRFVFLTAAALPFWVTAAPAWCQALAAFGTAPVSASMTQIRPFTEQEIRRVQNERACNISIPLVGGGEIKDADERILKRSIANYSAWESEFKLRSLIGSHLSKGTANSDIGALKYFDHRSRGMSAKTIDTFTRLFLIKNLYENEKRRLPASAAKSNT